MNVWSHQYYFYMLVDRVALCGCIKIRISWVSFYQLGSSSVHRYSLYLEKKIIKSLSCTFTIIWLWWSCGGWISNGVQVGCT